ncbi:hypothetical protein D3C78_1018170 [compost metagenome]
MAGGGGFGHLYGGAGGGIDEAGLAGGRWRLEEHVLLLQRDTAGCIGAARVGGALDQRRGRQRDRGELAGDGEQGGPHVDAGALHAHVVGAERAAGDFLGQVGVADEGFGCASVGVGFRIGAVDAAQERSDVAFQGAGIDARPGDAEVAGHVDGAGAGRGYVDDLDPVGVGDGVGAGHRHIHPDADAGEADLVVRLGYPAVEGGLQGRNVGQVDAGLLDEGVAGEPEGFVRKVGGEGHQLRVVVDSGRGEQRAHVGRRPRSPRDPRADRPGQAQVECAAVGILIPGGEVAVRQNIGAGVDGIQRRLDGAGQQPESEQGRHFRVWFVHDFALSCI